jgi:hypothetical protein
VEEEKKSGPCEEAGVFTRGCRGSHRAWMQGNLLCIRAHRRRNKEGCLMAALALGMSAAGSGSFPAIATIDRFLRAGRRLPLRSAACPRSSREVLPLHAGQLTTSCMARADAPPAGRYGERGAEDMAGCEGATPRLEGKPAAGTPIEGKLTAGPRVWRGGPAAGECVRREGRLRAC